ncbi:hypothetical protein BDZ91DRAFT_666069 [Kalaharituber pfeilii]|nr:hypothetical protein BDZ91DRAFT_666069 [Kalaharituber pfeilii]
MGCFNTERCSTGLQIIPSLLPCSTQRTLLSRLWIRDLCNPQHNTNLHLHYSIPYPDAGTSFYHYKDPNKVLLQPKDPATHKPMTVTQMLNKKLRWMTLGGQYDWSRKVYPEMDAIERKTLLVPFPDDTATLINSIFPDITPQAAISNLYTPGDTLSPHRDISEASSAPLASISIGADAIFIIGLPPRLSEPVDDGGERILVMRVKSGDVIVMGGESRWAWHSVPRIFPVSSATDKELDDWPGTSTNDEGVLNHWKGWMSKRRVNLNVRQMWD